MVAEIERIADGYTTVIEMGSSSTHLEVTAYDPGIGEVLDYFTIEPECVEAYLAGDPDWDELLTRIGKSSSRRNRVLRGPRRRRRWR